ncbi:MAG TPA: VIT domain-containing protein, partial [Gemmatimonadales bacterium]|nr:VIT domain-containing protein [Gemmatimonadales bacterium]
MRRSEAGPRPAIPDCRSSLVVLLLSLVAAPLGAQGWIDLERPIPVPGGSPVVRTSSTVRMSLDGRVARVEVTERFRNNGGAVAEGSYLYPLPGEAVFADFSLWSGEQELKGETMRAEEARRIYEEIVRRRKDPALLTLAGHGLVRAQVFPIQPGETRSIALRYTLVPVRTGDALRLHYALGVRGPERATDVEMAISDPDTYGEPFSPTHRLDTRREGGRLVLRVDPESGGDVEIFLPLRRKLAGGTVLTHAVPGEDGYFMLLLSPDRAAAGAAVPRDLTLVVDVSGSMSGAKMEQARAALHQALGTLEAQDRFQIVAFASAVRPFRPDLVPAGRENLAAAREFVDGLGAEGGTNIAGALDAALATLPDPERLSLFVLVTDGMPSVGERSPDRIAEAAVVHSGSRRIFTVGVGHDVNTYLLDRLATVGRGSVEYVPPGASVETAVGNLVSKLRHPALVDLRIERAPVELRQMQPERLPDLFYGEELVVFGRYTGSGNGTLVVSGTRNGRRERLEIGAAFESSSGQGEFIPRLWAARRIGQLTRQIALEGAAPGMVEEVRQLGLRHGILTEYTSYLVQEPNLVAVAPQLREDRRDATGPAAFERARASAKLSEASNLGTAGAANDALAARAPAAAG